MFELNVKFETKQELIAFLGNNDIVFGGPTPPQPKKATKKRAAKSVATDAATTFVQETAAILPVDPPAPPENTGLLDYDKDIKSAGMAFAAANSREELVAIFGHFGVANAKALKPEQYQEFLDLLASYEGVSAKYDDGGE